MKGMSTIMKENKRKINVVDICVLALIFLFVIGIGIRSAGISKPEVEDKKLQYVIEVKGVRSFTAEALEKSKNISDGVDKIYGNIVDVKVEEAQTEATTSDGEIVKTILPKRYNCYVTIESDAQKKDNIYYLDDEVRVAAGEWMEVITKYVKTSGTIASVSEIN